MKQEQAFNDKVKATGELRGKCEKQVQDWDKCEARRTQWVKQEGVSLGLNVDFYEVRSRFIIYSRT